MTSFLVTGLLFITRSAGTPNATHSCKLCIRRDAYELSSHHLTEDFGDKGFVLHLIKLAPGCNDLEALGARMRAGALRRGAQIIYTRTMPRRAEEILQGGSIFRVLGNMIAARQLVIGFESHTREDGNLGTMILVAPDIIAVHPRPVRPFQGWRYLKEDDAPPDLSSDAQASLQTMPDSLKNALASLCLI